MDGNIAGERAAAGRGATESTMVPGGHNIIDIAGSGHSGALREAPRRQRPPNAAWNVPHARNPFFTGREDVLAQIHAALTSGNGAAVTQAISGQAGIGKTHAAVEYAHRHRAEYTAVLWLSAASPEILTSGFSAIARLLGLPEANERDQSVIAAAVQRWLSANSGWLLILDDADDISIARIALPPTLPVAGHVLITTRATVPGGGAAGMVRLDKLPPSEGAALLLRRARLLAPDAPLSSITDADRAAALALSGELGGLPLALEQAGASIEEMPSTPQKYLTLFRARRAALLKNPGNPGEPEHVCVTITFTEGMKKLEKAHPVSAELLRLCAFLAPDAIPEEILIEGADELGEILETPMKDEAARAEAIHWACRWSLLEYDAGQETLSMHPLARVVIQDAMETGERMLWAERTVNAVAVSYPGQDFFYWSACERLLPHWQLCAEHIAGYGIETARAALLLIQAGVYQYNRAAYEAAEPFYQLALAIDEKAYGPEHPETATSLNNLAELYRAQGNYKAAEPLHQRALAIREKALGPDHPDTAGGLNNLALLYDNQGNYVDAEPLYQRALAIAEKTLGPEHPRTATTLNNLANLYHAQGNDAAAEPLYERAQAIKEKVYGPEHPLTAQNYWWLAGVRQKQGDFTEAVALYEHALTVFENALGPEHANTARCRENFAAMLRELGRIAEADELETRARAGQNRP